MGKKINVIIKRPGEPIGHMEVIEDKLAVLQDIVGGYIESVTLDSDFMIICNEEGRWKGFEHNAEICGVDFVGTVIGVGVDGEDLTDVPMTIEDWKYFCLGIRENATDC